MNRVSYVLAAGVVDPHHTANVVVCTLQHLGDECVLLRPSVTVATLQLNGPFPLRAYAERRLKERLRVGREIPTKDSLAVIRVAPVGGVVPLGSLIRELEYRLQGVNLLIIARALHRCDLRHEDRAIDDEPAR